MFNVVLGSLKIGLNAPIEVFVVTPELAIVPSTKANNTKVVDFLRVLDSGYTGRGFKVASNFFNRRWSSKCQNFVFCKIIFDYNMEYPKIVIWK